MGFSYKQISMVYGVSPRTVWERVNDKLYKASEKV